MSVYRNSAGTKAVRNRNKRDNKFLTKTTSATPNQSPVISRHSRGTNVQYNMNTNAESRISEEKRQCMNNSYYNCIQNSTCTWVWKEPGKVGYCG
tara:strand:- start:968 stop:1252 length:285 start_codon:yes stop_codon:yes gene_type:complete